MLVARGAARSRVVDLVTLAVGAGALRARKEEVAGAGIKVN